jgi:hypothetical protein
MNAKEAREKAEKAAKAIVRGKIALIMVGIEDAVKKGEICYEHIFVDWDSGHEEEINSYFKSLGYAVKISPLSVYRSITFTW